MIILQRVDMHAVGNEAYAERVLRVYDRYYVEVRHTLDASEPTLMRAVNQALDRFVLRTKLGRGYVAKEAGETN